MSLEGKRISELTEVSRVNKSSKLPIDTGGEEALSITLENLMESGVNAAIESLQLITWVDVLPPTGSTKYLYAVPREEVDKDGKKIAALYLWDGSAWRGAGAFSLNIDPATLATKAELAGYLPLSGGTVTGGLTISRNPGTRESLFKLYNESNGQGATFFQSSGSTIIAAAGGTNTLTLTFRSLIQEKNNKSYPILTTADKAVANGVASLDENAKVPAAQIPDLSSTYATINSLATVATSGSYNDLADKPTIPTVNDAEIEIQKNGTKVDSFTLNQPLNKIINIAVPTTAADISALPDSTKYAASLSLSVDPDTYVITGQLKDQDGNNLGTAGAIDLPLESVVVSGSYNSSTKKVVLTLKDGSTVEFSIADLVSGLQTEITSTNKLSADLIKDGTTNKTVTATEKSTWNSKQDAINDLSTIRSNAEAGANAATTISSYGDIVTHNADEFAEAEHAHVISDITNLQTTLDGKQATISDLPTIRANATAGANAASTIAGYGDIVTHDASEFLTEHQDISGKQDKIDDLATIRSGAAAGATAVQPDDLATVATSGSYADLLNKPTIPTVNDAEIEIQKNGTKVDSFTANQATAKTINITVPTTAADVSALPASTKYGYAFDLSIDPDTYIVSLTMKDQNGTAIGTTQTIDLPLESVVVNGSYDKTNKKIVLTLQSGSTVDVPVGDLIAGLQTQITSTNKLSADLLADGTTNKVVTATEKNTWNNKQAAISDLATIRSGAGKGATAVQPGDLAKVATSGSYTDLTNKPTIPTVTDKYSATSTNAMSGKAVASAIAHKMDKVTLATVATSGSYTDLTNKPTIPTVDSALSSTSTNAIQNKVVNTALAGKANATHTHASGDIKGLAKVATSGSYTDLTNKPTIPAAVTETTVSGWGFTKNAGTVTSVKINGTAKNPTSGVVDLGTVITAHQDISGKQDVISDLATIRSGAGKGATAVQPGDLATVATSGMYSDLTGTPGVATANTLGLVKPDGTTITVTEDGTIRATGGSTSNMVTTDTAQEITGAKSFESPITFSNNNGALNFQWRGSGLRVSGSDSNIYVGNTGYPLVLESSEPVKMNGKQIATIDDISATGGSGFDFEGTKAEFDAAVAAGTITEDSVSLITDDVSGANVATKSELQAVDRSKADTALSNVLANIDYVVESKFPTADDPTWYRVYKSGWVEQGGVIPAVVGNITFLKPFANTNYTVVGNVYLTYRRVGQGDGSGSVLFFPEATYFCYVSLAARNFGDIGNQKISWEAKGQGAA